MFDLTAAEAQKLVLMVGSKKALGTYLGLDPKQTDQIWNFHRLQTPINWLRAQPREAQLEMLAATGSLKALSKKLGCSEASLRIIYMGKPQKSLDWTEEFFLGQITHFKSVRLVAHMNDVSEGLIRRFAEDKKIDLAKFIDYSLGNSPNSKGRRAELDFAKLRGEHILEDKNLTEGSQASYDFDDDEYMRVNVKSSRAYSYRAQLRSEEKTYGKFSTSGWQTCDVFFLMLYDSKYQKLIGTKIMSAAECRRAKTITVNLNAMEASTRET